MDRADFLLARIADDEAVAQMGRPDDHLATRDRSSLAVERNSAGYSHVAATTGRVLAECSAKRAIVEAYREERTRRDIYWRADEADLNDEDRQERHRTDARTRGLEIAVEALALPYADHPDYASVEWSS